MRETMPYQNEMDYKMNCQNGMQKGNMMSPMGMCNKPMCCKCNPCPCMPKPKCCIINKYDVEEVPHYCNYHTHIVNNHVKKHVCVPKYTCSEEHKCIDQYCCGC